MCFFFHQKIIGRFLCHFLLLTRFTMDSVNGVKKSRALLSARRQVHSMADIFSVGKFPFYYFEQHFGRRKGIDGVFIGEKKGQILIRSIQFPKCQSLDFIYRTKKTRPHSFNPVRIQKVPLPPIDGGNCLFLDFVFPLEMTLC